jgi:glycosyltransferase involved in cell wall biosynthesis
MVAAADIADHVHFTGWIAEADKPALYSLASALLFPSLYEGFGLPVAEAAACGVPVVTSDRSALPEVTADAILVDPEDVDSIAAALEQALHAPRRPSTAARRTWAHVAAETMAVLEDASFPARGAAPGTGRPR